MNSERKIKEVIFFCYGDSSDASTWSNVPFLFTQSLIKHGVTVRRVNLSDGLDSITKLYNRSVVRFLKLFYGTRQFTYEFSRSIFYKAIVNRKIKKAVTKYSHADYCIFLCFDFYNKFNSIPSLLFCDWTYKILVIDRKKRKPYLFEKRFCKQQADAINNATHVISMFPTCTEYMKKDYPKANISYLGGNVINSLYMKSMNTDIILSAKRTSNKILFIGGKKYLDGAKKLVEAFLMLKGMENLELHLIGLKRSMLGNLPNNIFCHGYLRKDVAAERDIYYDLLISSKMIVNPTPNWGGYSSIVEAMYFYTPVIVSPYDDFVNEFGKDINFGIYNEKYDSSVLAQNIEAIFNSSDYENMCLNARERVKDYTWDNYVDKILRLLNN